MSKIAIVFIALSAGVATAQADVVDTYITADNHYALYSSDGGGVWGYHGRNELGPGGAPGTYNWSEAEHFTYNSVGGYLYIAAWSDNSSAQGLLADLQINGIDYSSGNAAWQVYRTNVDRGDGDAEPTLAEMAQYVLDANTSAFGNTWETPAVGGINGSQAPWAMVPGINSQTARWMWVNNPNQPDPFSPGTGYGEMLVFRISVPTPGAAAFLGLGMLGATRRRRA
jgi:MYXO-CTERM domain-containing protein